jgi:cytochrome c biogenesis factor
MKQFNYSIQAFITHVGLCVFIISVVLYGTYSSEEQLTLHVKQAVRTNSGYGCLFTKISEHSADGHKHYTIRIACKTPSGNVVNLDPYVIVSRANGATYFPATYRVGLSDIYIEPCKISSNQPHYANDAENIRDVDEISIIFSIKEYIYLVWFGGGVMLLGLILSVIKQNRKKKIMAKLS